MTLDQLQQNEHAIIHSIEDEELASLLISMGFIIGESISVERIAPLNDPIVISSGNHQMCIRRKDAKKVMVTINQESIGR